MKDRIPTQVVNGAIRMEQLDENGNHIGYIYLKRADAPSVEGTPYNVENVLTDNTATAIGLDVTSNPTPNDAFAKIAERFDDFKYVNARLDALETSTMYPATFYTESATFTASQTGKYRFTLVGQGGQGGSWKDSSSSSYAAAGGGGGAGAVCVVIAQLQAAQSFSLVIDGYASITGVATANAGENGKAKDRITGGSTDGGAGGTGGTGVAYTNNYSVHIYNGGAGGTGKQRTQNEIENAGIGGNVSYYFPGQMVDNDYSGTGIFVAYNLGYGGRGGFSSLHPPAKGGPAGIVVEFLG